MQAAACVLFAARVLRKPQEWPTAVAQCSGYTAVDLHAPITTLEEWMMRVPTHKFQAVRKKFSHAKYHEIAKRFDRWAARAAEGGETARGRRGASSGGTGAAVAPPVEP